MEELITVKELGNLFGLKKSYIYKLTHTGQLPHYKPFGKKIYFKKSEISEILESSKMEVSNTNCTKDKVDLYYLRYNQK